MLLYVAITEEVSLVAWGLSYAKDITNLDRNLKCHFSMSSNNKQFTHANHYVPQAYLKRWAQADDKVWSSRLLVPHEQVPVWKKVSPRGLAKHQHLYTRTIVTGESDEIEHWLNAEFETPAQEAIQKAVLGARMSRADWRALVRFLAAQDARTPARMHEGVKRWERTLPAILNDVLEGAVEKFKNAKRTGNPINVQSQPYANHFPLKISKEFQPGEENGTLQVHTIAGRGLWLFGLRHLLTQTIEVLLQHKWTIVECPEEMNWMTSDDPVIKLNARSETDYDFKGGWGSKGTEIFLPLGPRHLLYTAVGYRGPVRGTTLSIDVGRRFQRFNVEHAHRYVFATNPDPDVEIWRPRHVNAADFRFESEQWAQWHSAQLRAERALMDPLENANADPAAAAD